MHLEDEAFCEKFKKAGFEMGLLSNKVRSCRKCPCLKDRHTPLPGSGYPQADLLIIKGNPSAEEVASGIAFTGETSEAIRSILNALTKNPAFVFVTNAVKCAVDSRGKASSCISDCSSWLRSEVYILRPKLVVAFGPIAYEALKLISISQEMQADHAPGRMIKWMPGATLVTTLDLEESLKSKSAKLEVWRHLQLIQQNNL